MFDFKILKKSRKSGARLGILQTPHGEITTPAFVPCATKGTLKSLGPQDIDDLNLQMVFVNAYHMVLSPGVDMVQKAGGIHKFSGIKKPIITDSGGFQVFSLARSSTPGVFPLRSPTPGVINPTLVKITDDGVKFRSHIDGKEFYFTPEFSIEAQMKIGADFIVAFDECVPYGSTRKYTEKSLKRTHEWAKRSLQSFTTSKVPSLTRRGIKEEVVSTPAKQSIYGVIQGGTFEDLRKESAKFISALPFFGLAIGGVSVGESKKEMREQVSSVMKIIKDDLRPRHLLGVGEFDDIIDAVKMGVDTMDCVIPTRYARMGKLYIAFSDQRLAFSSGNIDILKSNFKNDLKPVDETCSCYTCQNFSRAYLHHLFKQRELLAYRLATIHNLFFMERFFEKIRGQIDKGVW